MGWTQSHHLASHSHAYYDYETSVLIPLAMSIEEVYFMKQPVLIHNCLFVNVWLLVVDVFIQNILSALTCLRLVDNGVFGNLRCRETFRLTFLRMRNKCKIINVQRNNKAFSV